MQHSPLVLIAETFPTGMSFVSCLGELLLITIFSFQVDWHLPRSCANESTFPCLTHSKKSTVCAWVDCCTSLHCSAIYAGQGPFLLRWVPPPVLFLTLIVLPLSLCQRALPRSTHSLVVFTLWRIPMSFKFVVSF